jgi:predicted deacylase
VSQRIAHAITTEIIDRSDYLVDMHSGDGNESLRPYLYWNKLGVDTDVDEKARQMALAWGNDHIVVDTTRTKDVKNSIYTQNTAHLRGKPALTTENGYLGLPVEEMVEKNVAGASRLMRHLGMLPGPVEMTPAPVWLTRYEVLTSPETGIWAAAVDLAPPSRGDGDRPGDRLVRQPARQVKGAVRRRGHVRDQHPGDEQGEPVGMVNALSLA